ncbi:MAG: YtxH domain-containing protein [Nostocaceae cyanobacterium CSU_2_110]|nr:YtxH domain-containing protein [Nostocaceae cyanobacterium CSU_2_110]
MTNTGKVVTGVLVGTAIGATLGLLFAPKKGSKTRAIIADKAKDLGDATLKTYAKTKDLLGIKKDKQKELAMN